jgi:hypothetical protein
LPAKAILLQRIRGLVHRVRQQAGSYRFLRTPKARGVARIVGSCIRQTLPVLHRSPVGARLPAKAILLQRIRGLVHRVRQQAGSYRFLRTPKARGVARIVGSCVRRTLPVTPGSTVSAYAEGGRYPRIVGFCVCQTLPVLHRSPVGARLPAKAILLQRIRGLVHRIRQQAGSYRFLRTPKAVGIPGLTDFAYAKRCRCCTDHL